MPFFHHKLRHVCLCFSAALLGACEKPSEPGGVVEATVAESGFSEAPADIAAMPFSNWKTKAELQIMLEQLPQGSYFAAIEGRNLGGLSQYRAVSIPYTDSGHDLWALYWGLDDKEFFDTELMLLRKGFRRQQLQMFVDASGVARHQMVYLHPVGAGEMEAVLDVVPPAVAVNPTPVEVPEEAPPAQDLPEIAADRLPSDQADPAEDTPPPAAIPPEVREIIHIVSPGDTLGAVAKKYGVSVSRLKSANALRTDVLRIGQKLKVPRGR